MKRTIGILLLLITIMAYSQKDEKASALLEEVSQKTKDYTSFKADFTYSMDNKAARIHETKTGTLFVSGNRYKVNVAGQEVFCDGTTVWTYIRESNEVQINIMDTRKDAITPTNILSSYTDNYHSRIISDPDAIAADAEAVELVPNLPGNYTQVVVIIDKKEKQIRSFRIYDKSGNIFTYKVNRFQTNLPVADSDFVFRESMYPQVEVIDMR